MDKTAPLIYKNIGTEAHLTFESIQKLAFLQLSEFGERKARQHIAHCYRCQSIYESFTRPVEVRKRHHHKSGRWRLLLLAMVITPASLLYLGGSSNLDLKDLPYFENLSSLLQKQFIAKDRGTKQIPNYSTATEPGIDSKSRVEANALKHSDTLTVVSSKTKVESASSSSNHSGANLETQQVRKNKLRGIYGKIMANGKPLKGVTIMVPGSHVAKVSNSEGKYYIQVPTNIDSLKFIYRGKQLVKELDSTSRERDLYLNIERPYPEIDISESSGKGIVSN